MGSPNTTSNDPIMGAIEEIISAISSLHMTPEPLEPFDGQGEFLVDRDRFAKHAHEHLQQAMIYLRKVRPEDLNQCAPNAPSSSRS